MKINRVVTAGCAALALVSFSVYGGVSVAQPLVGCPAHAAAAANASDEEDSEKCGGGKCGGGQEKEASDESASSSSSAKASEA